MRCERARVYMYVWARDPGQKWAFFKTGELLIYRRVRLYSCVFRKTAEAEAVSRRRLTIRYSVRLQSPKRQFANR